jgi:hypothetical protein
MHVAVLLLILGQVLLFGRVRVLEYGIAVWVGFYLLSPHVRGADTAEKLRS